MDDTYRIQKLDATVNHYSRFGLRVNASKEEIRKKYLKYAIRTHPDKFRGNLSLLDQKTKEWHDVSNTFEALQDKTTREQYDEEQRQYLQQQQEIR